MAYAGGLNIIVLSFLLKFKFLHIEIMLLDKESFVKSPILVIHGDKDTILEPKYFNEACNILDTQGYFYESHLLVDLEHTISEKTIDLTKKFIKKCMT